MSTHPVQLLPHIVLWEPAAWRGFPGYGWLFPGVDGRANVGLGLGMLSDRTAGARAARDFGAFLEHLQHLGVLDGSSAPASMANRLGGWLKLGMIGTTPARGRVALVGDAAGLVNPLQGEGISQAMRSGRAAAEAVLAAPEAPAMRYRAWLDSTYTPYLSVAAPAHGALAASSESNCRRGAGSHGTRRGTGDRRRLVDLLERPARGSRPASSSYARIHGRSCRPRGDGPKPHAAMARSRGCTVGSTRDRPA